VSYFNIVLLSVILLNAMAPRLAAMMLGTGVIGLKVTKLMFSAAVFHRHDPQHNYIQHFDIQYIE
jgi:hypothetical protein